MLKFFHFGKSQKKKDLDEARRQVKKELDEMEFVLAGVRVKMYDEAFRLEKERQEKGGVFGAE